MLQFRRIFEKEGVFSPLLRPTSNSPGIAPYSLVLLPITGTPSHRLGPTKNICGACKKEGVASPSCQGPGRISCEAPVDTHLQAEEHSIGCLPPLLNTPLQFRCYDTNPKAYEFQQRLPASGTLPVVYASSSHRYPPTASQSSKEARTGLIESRGAETLIQYLTRRVMSPPLFLKNPIC